MDNNELVLVKLEKDTGIKTGFVKSSDLEIIQSEYVWYKNAYSFSEGFAAVQREDGLWNFMREDGSYISDVWYKEVRSFSEGFAAVRRFVPDEEIKSYIVLYSNVWNFIDTTGKIISEEWFDGVKDFKDGFACVSNGYHKCNALNTKGKLISENWYKTFGEFVDGYAVISRSLDEWNLIDCEGKLFSSKWYAYVSDVMLKNKYVLIRRKDTCYNLLDLSGKLLIRKWSKVIYAWHGYFEIVYSLNRRYLLNVRNNFICKVSFKNSIKISEETVMIQRWDGKCNFIDLNTNSVGDKWYRMIKPFCDGVATVKYKGKLYYIDTNGKIIE